MHAGRYPDDPELSALIGELSVKSGDFAAWWAAHEVRRRSHGTKRYHHPIAGELTIAYEALPIPEATDQTLFIYTAEPESSSQRALELLASWAFSAPEHQPGASP